ncbi:hypothetical protein [Mammaliicoccus lentus]|uniref:Uncharacterized protein n=1 Tax=Mammaliicoccus lentus TaxID=42858 RepID=A0ABS6GU18_MAMLE|nr:hypothetical protein [Mammaliicoccus lentus]MBU6112524.1 hypothetical protein [Mammaliicoccus lentus]
MKYLITYHDYDIEDEFENISLLIKHIIEVFMDNGYFISRRLDNKRIIKLYEQEFGCYIHSYEKLGD